MKIFNMPPRGKMPIKLTYKIIDDRSFLETLKQLSNYPFRNQRFSYNVSKIWRRLISEVEAANEQWIKLLKQYAELDEKGSFVPKTEDAPHSFKIIEGKEAEFEAAKKDFEAVGFEIDCHPLKLEQLEQMPISGTQIDTLAPLFDFTEDSAEAQ
jgi:hypothetical protein